MDNNANASASTTESVQANNIFSGISKGNSSEGNVSGKGNNNNNAQVLSEYEAMAAKRRDVIAELLKELVRVGIHRINFIDLIIDYIASGEFRYSLRNEVIKKYFISDELLTVHEMEDYAAFRTLEKLAQQRPGNQDLKVRIGNLKYKGEAFACIYQCFLDVIREDPVFFGFAFEKVLDSQTDEEIVRLIVPSLDMTASTFATSRLRDSTQVRKATAARTQKRKATMELKKNVAMAEKEAATPISFDETLVNKRRKLSTKTHDTFEEDMVIAWENLERAKKNMYNSIVRKKTVNAVRCQIARLKNQGKVTESSYLRHALDLYRGKERL